MCYCYYIYIIIYGYISLINNFDCIIINLYSMVHDTVILLGLKMTYLMLLLIIMILSDEVMRCNNVNNEYH